ADGWGIRSKSFPTTRISTILTNPDSFFGRPETIEHFEAWLRAGLGWGAKNLEVFELVKYSS
ncbi:MAG TPA: hypothetical protein DCP63_05605, partial [Bacteroidetes bacterium]|nr:hypothetical protein [Bacteroidota bacterium]